MINRPSLLRSIHSMLLLSFLIGSLIGSVPAAHAFAGATRVEQGRPGSAPGFYKVAVNRTGIHAITYDQLAAAGLPVDVDPRTFRLYEQGSEISRQVIDADATGVFTPGDSIQFYGRAVRTAYTTTNIYWLTWGTTPGQAMAARDASPDSALPRVATFREVVHLEQDLRWMKALPLTGEADRWYWYLYQTSCSSSKPGKFSTTVNMPGVAVGAFTASLTPRLRGFNDVNHTAVFDLNGVGIGQASFSGKNEYLGTFSFGQSLLLEGDNTVTLTAPCPTTATTDWGVVNWYDLAYHRTYAAPATGQFPFAVDTAQDSLVTLEGLTAGPIHVYDITDPLNPVHVTGGQAVLAAVAADLSFSHTAGVPARYIAATPDQLLAPATITEDAPSSLRAPGIDEPAASGADWIIITPAEFRSEAERLAAHRQTYQGYRTAVIDVQDVYDEFNGGLKDQQAIRDFLRHAHETWPQPAPQFVVLLGDGHYDPRNILGNNTTDFIPPYLAAVNPFDGVVAADNRYVAYDPVPPASNPVPFMALGRLPANTLADADAMVDKIIEYETLPAHDSWNRDVLFIADNADTGGNFPLNSDEVAEDISYLPAEFDRQKVHLGVNYTDKTLANTAIIDAINQGALFVNYHGHASVQNWAGEPLLSLADQSRMTNAGKHPIFLPMTCLEGDFIDPSSSKQSFAESVVRRPAAGAVASWSPSGKGVASGHDVIYRGFYEAVFQQGVTLIGPATTFAKQSLSASPTVFKDLIDSYTLFGDPAMPLDLPSPDLSVQKQVSPAPPWQPGQAVTYTLTYRNRAGALATGVRLTDTLPSELTHGTWTASDPAVALIAGSQFAWQLPDLPAGREGTLTIEALVSPAVSVATTITNTAVIAGSQGERPALFVNNTARAAGNIDPILHPLSGLTFHDTDGDGVLDPGETPLAGVPVTVTDVDGATLAITTSDSRGEWQVNLPSSTYIVTVPASYNGLAVTSSAHVTVGVGGGSASVDFGYASPTGIEIEFPQAHWTRSGARITWITRLEDTVQEFYLYRTNDPAQHGVRISVEPIAPKAPPGEGASYEYVDPAVKPDRQIHYWLVVVSTAGEWVWVGPIQPAWSGSLYLPSVRR